MGGPHIRWTVYGKIRSISKAGSSVQYRYDASANWIHKLVQAGGLDTHTYYARDAQGNVMAVYGYSPDNNDSQF